jgi:hypothetical protein
MNLAILARPSYAQGEDKSYNTQSQSESNEFEQVGTPNDVRMFPTKKSMSSPSIPIKHVEKSLSVLHSELQLHEEEALAEYRDYCMYHRIVSGRTSKSFDSHEKHGNIELARNARLVPEENSSHFCLICAANQNNHQAYDNRDRGVCIFISDAMMMPEASQQELHSYQQYEQEEEGIFDLEL